MEERLNWGGGCSRGVVDVLEFLVEMEPQVFVVDGGVCRRFRGEMKGGLRCWVFRE